MDSAKLNDRLRIAGLFAVVACLKFVGLQLKLSQEIAVAAQYQERMSATMAHWDAVLRSKHGPSIVFSDAKNWAKGPMQAICVAELWLIFAFDNHHFQFSAR